MFPSVRLHRPTRIRGFASALVLAAGLTAGALPASAPASAQTATAKPGEAARGGMAPLSAEDRALVKQAETYLNGVETMEAQFTQVDSANKRATGKIYLARPGRMRFEYDPPVPVLIVANGRHLIHYDRDLKTASYINQRDTPAWFLLSPKIELQGDVTVTDVRRREGRVLISIIKTSEPNQGTVTLVFDENPMRLAQWAVSDAQGVVTYVTLRDPKFGTKIEDSRFEFNEPVWSDRPR